MFCGTSEHEVGLTCHKASLCSVEVVLVLLKFDHNGGDIVVDLPVACNFLCQAPVVTLGHPCLENVEITAGAGEHVAESRG
jgi:hypothetical protein